MSKSKKTNTTQQSTTVQGPSGAYADMVNGNFADTKARVAAMTPYTGQRVAGFNDLQLRAQQGLLDLSAQKVGSGLLSQAAQTAQGAAAYQPLQISARAYTPATAQASLAQAVSRNQVRDVAAGAISPDAIAAYANPFDSQVIAQTLADLDRQKRIEQVQNASAATRAHAFGGTGAAVMQGMTNDSYARQSALTAANLRQAGWNTALQAAQTDRAARLTADQANQNADLSMAGLLNSNAIANAQARQQADQFNATSQNEAGRFTAGQDFAAQQANQQAGLAANQQGIAAAGLLGNLADQQRAHALGDLNMVSQVGDARQAQLQRELEAAIQAHTEGQALTVQQQQMLNTAMALIPATTTVSQDGKSTTVEKSPVNVLGAIGSIVGMMTGLGWAPLAASAASGGK